MTKDEAFLTIIEKNYTDNELTLKNIVERLCITDRTLQYRTKQLLGKSPMQYLREYRIERAKELIISENISIARIAEQVGFSNQPYFTKCFKQHTGVTPRQYRNHMATILNTDNGGANFK